ncbi:MAG: polyamine aminopropyltransferase [Gammaproteobacteria bacterium]|nr:polyamine aminopropyltransferase [Gammaproteobacteria bacterium]
MDTPRQFVELLYDDYGQLFEIDEVLFERRTDHQHLVIFRHGKFGRVMALDGVIQTTEKDEFIYHEMLTHVPLLGHGSARRVLIIGGGDGGMLREVTRHADVQSITQVEIDPQVVEMCRTYLPGHSRGAFDDPRLELVFADGAAFMRESDARFDVIIIDSTDPIGPGKVLFSESFYRDCAARLADGGIIVTQNGVAWMQLDEAISTGRAFARLFPDWHFFSAAVPTYVGGIMLFGWGATDRQRDTLDLATLRERYDRAGLRTRYYTPELHHASFALPAYVMDALQ